jgi:hypothetical protein
VTKIAKPGVALHALDRARIDRAHQVHAADSSALTRALSSPMPDELDLVEVGLAGLPVGVVAHHQRAHAGLEFLELVGPGADAGVEVGGAFLDDVEVEGAEDHRQVGVRRAQHNGHLGGPLAFTLSIWSASTLAIRGGGRVLVAHQRDTTLGRRERLARRGKSPLAHGEDPGLRILGRERFGQARLRREAAVRRVRPL